MAKQHQEKLENLVTQIDLFSRILDTLPEIIKIIETSKESKTEKVQVANEIASLRDEVLQMDTKRYIAGEDEQLKDFFNIESLEIDQIKAFQKSLKAHIIKNKELIILAEKLKHMSSQIKKLQIIMDETDAIKDLIEEIPYIIKHKERTFNKPSNF